MRALTARVPKSVVRGEHDETTQHSERLATIALGPAFFAITAGSTARAAEIKLLSAVALQPGFIALIPDFEKSSGHKVTTTNGTAGVVADRVQKGEAADIVINSGPRIDQLQAQGKVVAGSRVNIAKVVPNPTLRRSMDSNGRCWLQNRLLTLIPPAAVRAAFTLQACSNDWASLRK